MDAEGIYSLLEQSENEKLECKEAKNDLPQKDFRRTYSAFANTDGGTILLGIKEDVAKKEYEIIGVNKVDKVIKHIWDAVSDHTLISVNLLNNDLVNIIEIEGKQVVSVTIPRAPRLQRPVYINNNPFLGTYRRGYEGNYTCSVQEVKQMISEADNHSVYDRKVAKNFTFDDIDLDTFKKYRQRFQNRNPEDMRNDLDDIDFLKRIGGYLRDREENIEGLTIAGLLVFGKEESILEKFPFFFLDYREKDEEAVRWKHRITSQHNVGSGNLYSFYNTVIQRLLSRLSIPFRIEEDGTRSGDTRIHRALREALLNTFIHADYQAEQSVIVEVRPKGFYFENPGGLRLPVNSAIEGGQSDPRNPTIFQIFSLIGLGERSGYGLAEIFKAWEEQHFQVPLLKDCVSPNRTILELSMVSLLPPVSLLFIKKQLGESYSTLLIQEITALVIAHAERQVTNIKLRKLIQMDSTEATTLLKSLVERGLLEAHGSNRHRVYTLSSFFPEDTADPETVNEVPPEDTSKRETERKVPSEDKSKSKTENEVPPEDTSKRETEGEVPSEDTSESKTENKVPSNLTYDSTLTYLQGKIQNKTIQSEEIILFIKLLCFKNKKTVYELGEALSLNAKYLRRKYMNPLVKAQDLDVTTGAHGLHYYETKANPLVE